MRRLALSLAVLPALSLAGFAALGEGNAEAEMVDMRAMVSRCAFCHGPSGQSENEIWPSIAGLDAAYIEAQLDAFAEGRTGPRKGPHAAQMYAISALLSAPERKQIAAHYAALPAAPWSADGSPAARALHHEGQGAVLACGSCHGAEAEGMPELGAPRLAGQPARYTSTQIAAYASGLRSDNGSGMAAIAQAMSEADIRAVAKYLEGD